MFRSEDGCLYRARVVVPEEITVQFIDFGNTEAVEVVYQHPACIGLELAPAAAEVVLARCLVSTGETKKKVLEDCLMLSLIHISEPTRRRGIAGYGVGV